jgi:hypothetical protein
MNSRPDSPCIGVCTLDDQHEVCLGCCRTVGEITRWTRMTPAEQWAVVEDLARRRALAEAGARVEA